MAHSISRRKWEESERREREARLREEARKRIPEIRAAKNIVGIWNARQIAGKETWFYPTIGAAITAGCPILRYVCPGCQQLGEKDLRRLDRHKDAAISGLIPSLSCTRCCPNPPFARLLELTK